MTNQLNKTYLKYRTVAKLIPAFLCMAIIMSSCEKEITLDIPVPEAKIVVEGSIESGLPPIVTLTNTVGFYGNINFNAIENYYVHDAEVTISDGVESVALQEFCLGEIPDDIKPLVAAYLGIELDSIGNFPVDICLYTVPDIFTGTPAFTGHENMTYTLTIHAEGKTVTSTTTIPALVHLDSIYFKPADDPTNDTLVRLYGFLTDPPAIGNYYRIFTSQNFSPFYTDFNSVAEDFIFNGQSFEFNINRGQPATEDFNSDTYGYFWRGDTVIVKFSSIDRPSYDFWNTLSYDSGTDGPFSSSTIVKTNIENGIGVWCGYATTYDTLFIPLEP